jgi:hypothetical protein
VTGPAHHFLFSTANNGSVTPGEVAFALQHRRWAGLSLSNDVAVHPFAFSPMDKIVTAITLETDFQKKVLVFYDFFGYIILIQCY